MPELDERQIPLEGDFLDLQNIHGVVILSVCDRLGVTVPTQHARSQQITVEPLLDGVRAVCDHIVHRGQWKKVLSPPDRECAPT